MLIFLFACQSAAAAIHISQLGGGTCYDLVEESAGVSMAPVVSIADMSTE